MENQRQPNDPLDRIPDDGWDDDTSDVPLLPDYDLDNPPAPCERDQ